MSDRHGKIIIITVIEGEDVAAILARCRREHRTGHIEIHLSQGAPSRIEWHETMRPPAPSPVRIVVSRPPASLG